MTNNPIIQRELISMLRHKRTLALQVLLVACLGMLVLLRWPSDAIADLSGTQAQEVLRIFGYGLLTGIVLLAPVFPATSLVREKQAGTLALLLNTPMTRYAIYSGKLVAALGFAIILLMLSLPAAAACYTMGGVDLTGQLAMMYIVLVLTALQYATLALLVSTYAGSSDSALRTTYGLVLILGLVTLGPHQFLHGLAWFDRMTFGIGLAAVEWFRCISPVPAMMELMGHGGIGEQGMVAGSHVALRFCLIAAASSVGFAAWTISRLDRTMFDKPRAAGTMTEDMTERQRMLRRIFYLFDPKKRGKLIGPLANPVMMKEFRARRFGRASWILRMAAGCMIVSLGLMLAATNSTTDWGVETLGSIMVLLQVALIVLVTPSLASGMIAAERESGSWQLLRMTPMRAHTIVLGKLLSVSWIVVLLLLATLPGYLVMYFIDQTQQARIAQVLVSLLLTAAFSMLLSAAVSSLFVRTAAATVTAYAVLVTLCAGTMLMWLSQDAPFSQPVVEAVLMFNPLAAALQLIEAPGFAEYNLIPGNWYVMLAACAISIAVLVGQTMRLYRPQ